MDEKTTPISTEEHLENSVDRNEKTSAVKSPVKEATKVDLDYTAGIESTAVNATELAPISDVDIEADNATELAPTSDIDVQAVNATELVPTSNVDFQAVNATESAPTSDVDIQADNTTVTPEENVNNLDQLNSEVSCYEENVDEKNPPPKANEENISDVKDKDIKDNNDESPVDSKIIETSKDKSSSDVEKGITGNSFITVESKQIDSTSDIRLVQDETVDSSKEIEDISKEVSENKDCESENSEPIEKTNVNEDKTSEVQELDEILTEKRDKTDQLESIENIEKYMDDTSNQEAPKIDSDIKRIANEQSKITEESKAPVSMETDSLESTGETSKPSETVVKNLNENSKVIPSESNRENKILFEDIQTEEKEEQIKKGWENEVNNTDNSESTVIFPNLEKCKNNETMDIDCDSNYLHVSANDKNNEPMDVDSDSNILQVSTNEIKPSLESSKKNESPKRKVSSRPRKDPVAVAPLSFSKLYYLDSDKNFTGFFSEYYDSTIYMYRGYWNYVKGEHDIPIRPLPEYKSTLYQNYKPPVAQLQPTVQTSSGRIVKKKEFTPSVPSSHQVSKRDQQPSSTKKEASSFKKESLSVKKDTPVSKKESKKDPPVTKKELKKEPKEDAWRSRYRLPLEKFGWKREVVFRTNSATPSPNAADIYYYSPKGKKLRSIREIIDTLDENDELKPFHFSFVRELLGFGSPLEVSREAVSRTLTNCDEDTPKRSKTTPVNRKVFFDKGSSILSSSGKPKSETQRVQNITYKVNKHLQSSSGSVKRARDDTDTEDSPPSPSKKPSLSTAKPVNGDLSKSEQSKSSSKPVESKLAASPLGKVKTSTDAPHKKLSSASPTEIKTSSEQKKSHSSQSENKVPNSSFMSKHKSGDSISDKPPSGKKRKVGPLSEKQSVKSVPVVAKSPCEEKSPVKPVSAVAKPVAPSPPIRRIVHSNKNLVNEVSNQFNAMVYLCRYLRVEDLLSVARVNRMFNAAAHSHQLWQVVKLKNSKVRNWNGLADCLTRHGTHTLDMLKMIGSADPDENDEIWNQFYKVIGKIHSLKRLELGRVTAAEILNAASNCSKNLTEFSVIAQKLATIDLKLFQGLPNLEILQLRSFESKREHGLIMMNIPVLAQMRNLRHLSLTGVKNLKSYQVGVLKDFPPLDSLELGDCTKLDERFPECSLAHMTSLVRLRLEMVQGNTANRFVETIATLPRLRTLELINIDTKKGFDEVFGRLSRVEHLLIFPTYITQSSTTNWLVLSGLARLQTTLKFLTWGLTQELLRVTTLFIEQWNAQLNLEEGVSKLDPEELKKTIVESNSIPVMKPLPEKFECVHSAPGKGDGHSGKQNISELDILPIDELKAMLEKVLCDTKIKLITVPVSSTTRIYLPSN